MKVRVERSRGMETVITEDFVTTFVTDFSGDLINLYVVSNCTQKRNELVNDPIS
jgi:hypothetical protein